MRALRQPVLPREPAVGAAPPAAAMAPRPPAGAPPPQACEARPRRRQTAPSACPPHSPLGAAPPLARRCGAAPAAAPPRLPRACPAASAAAARPPCHGPPLHSFLMPRVACAVHSRPSPHVPAANDLRALLRAHLEASGARAAPPPPGTAARCDAAASTRALAVPGCSPLAPAPCCWRERPGGRATLPAARRVAHKRAPSRHAPGCKRQQLTSCRCTTRHQGHRVA